MNSLTGHFRTSPGHSKELPAAEAGLSGTAGTLRFTSAQQQHQLCALRCRFCSHTSLRRARSAPGRLAGGKPRKMQLRAVGTAAGPHLGRSAPERPLPVAARPDAVGCTNCVAWRGKKSELFLHLPSQAASSSGETLAAEPGGSLRSFPRIPVADISSSQRDAAALCEADRTDRDSRCLVGRNRPIEEAVAW